MKTTQERFNELKQSPDIENYLNTNESEFLNQTTNDALNTILCNSGMSLSDVVRLSGVGDYAYKVFSGTRRASRNIIIALCIAMKASLAEIQAMLRISGNQLLDPRNKRDSVIIFSVNYKKTVAETDDILEERGLQTLNMK